MTTINFTTFPPDVCEELVNLEYKELPQLPPLYFEQWGLLEKKYNNWLKETNEQLFKDVHSFVDDSLRNLGFNTHRIKAAALILGYNYGDHIPTLDVLETSVNRKVDKILRIKPSIQKKTELISVLQQIEEFNNLIVIIDQTESMEPSIIELLVVSLFDLRIKNRTVMLLFCMFSNQYGLGKLMSANILSRMSKMSIIVKQPVEMYEDLKRRLIAAEGLSFKLGPKTVDMIYSNFTSRDSSISSVKHLVQYAMLVHYQDNTSTNPSDLEAARELISYHAFVCHQIFLYTDLLKDETGLAFPADVIDVYEQLFIEKYKDLGCSTVMYDAIGKLASCTVERILKRMECSLKNKPSDDREKREDVYYILKDYKGKLENNDKNQQKIVSKLINALRSHISGLKNPSKFPHFKSVYYDNEKELEERILPARREKALEYIKRSSSHLSSLLNLINNSREELNLEDLFNDFKQSIPDTDEGLLKSIFNDALDCLEYQGFVKKELRRSKGGLIRKTVWL